MKNSMESRCWDYHREFSVGTCSLVIFIEGTTTTDLDGNEVEMPDCDFSIGKLA